MLQAGFILRIIVIAFSIFFFLPQFSYAARTPRCTDVDPGSAPAITSVTTEGTQVTLSWSQAMEPVTHYTLAYGPTKEQLIYGAPNIGPAGTGSYTVDQLTAGQRYYFRIRAVNNCEPGDFSDTVSVVVGVQKDAVKLEIPRLSFLRQESNATYSAKDDEKWKKGMSILGTKASNQCGDCMSIPLLITEIVVLLFYFFLSHKISFLKPIYSVGIPIVFYLLFLFINRNCNSYFFFCEYFGILSLLSFILILLVQKQVFFHKLLAPHLVEDTKGSKKHD